MPRKSGTSFNSSQLVRLLAGLQLAEVVDSQQTVAERLSQWVDWTDAASLSDALSLGPTAPTRPRLERGGSPAVAVETARLRASLARDIATDPRLAGTGSVEAQRRMAVAAPPQITSVDRESLQAAYLAHQQAMSSAITPLRERLRAALSAHSVTLGQLAALDAALERALAGRERQLLASVPLLLDKKASRTRGDAARENEPIAALGRTMQQLLLAELEMRLQAVDGMLAALADETRTLS